LTLLYAVLHKELRFWGFLSRPWLQRDLMPVEDQMLRFEVDFWIPAFAGMTEGTGAQVCHAGEGRHPGVVPETQLVNPNKYTWQGRQQGGQKRYRCLLGQLLESGCCMEALDDPPLVVQDNQV
jgi:hypothetical protein